MILGIGTDIVSVVRIKRLLDVHGERFVHRYFDPKEYADSKKGLSEHHYAKRFAAKEAVAKALGTGFGHGINWRDIIIVNNSQGQPIVFLEGGAALKMQELARQKSSTFPVKCDISISDEDLYAVAFAIISA